MMKKIYALMLIGLFALSMIPVSASAYNQNNGDTDSSVNYFLTKAGVTDSVTSDTAKNKTLENDWNRAKNEFTKVKPKIDSFNKLSLTDKDDVLEKIRAYLDLTLDTSISKLKTLKDWTNRIITADYLNKKILDMLDEDISELKELKQRVHEAKTLDELRTLSKEIKTKWNEIRKDIKWINKELLKARLELIIYKLELVSEKLHERIDGLNQNTPEVEEMQILLDNFDRYIGLAKKQLALAREKLSVDSIGKPMISSDVDDVSGHLRKAHQYLREAFKTLRELLKLYREYSTETAPEKEPQLYLNLNDS